MLKKFIKHCIKMNAAILAAGIILLMCLAQLSCNLEDIFSGAGGCVVNIDATQIEEASSFAITLEGPGSPPSDKLTGSKEETFTNLAKGVWSVLVVAYDDEDNEIGSGLNWVVVNVNEVTPVTVKILPKCSYTIIATAGVGGTISPAGKLRVSQGANKRFTITADNCHFIADVLVDDVSVGVVSEYTFSNITANHTIEAVFTGKQYSITANAGAGGAVSPPGTTIYDCGSDVIFSFEPDRCYRIASLIVDGEFVDIENPYIFRDLDADHTISVSFIQAGYTIDASAGPGGSISPSGSIDVDCGDSITFDVTPDACYVIQNIFVDEEPMGAVPSLTFSNIRENITIRAVFAIRRYIIDASAGSGGSINPSGRLSVDCGSSRTFNFTPDDCYEISDVIVDGVSQGAVNSYRFTNIRANHTIRAEFAIREYIIIASAGTGGSISPAGSISVNCGSSRTFNIIADDCYVIEDVIVDGASRGAISTYTFNSVRADHRITASFTRKVCNISYRVEGDSGYSVGPRTVLCGVPFEIEAIGRDSNTYFDIWDAEPRSCASFLHAEGYKTTATIYCDVTIIALFENLP